MLTLLRFMILAVFAIIPSSIACAQEIASKDDHAIARVVAAQALQDLVRNWSVEVDAAEVVIADRLSGCSLPHGASETERVSDAYTRSANGEIVESAELEYRAPSFDSDLVISPTSTIPKEIVRWCWGSVATVRLSSMTLDAAIQTVMEDSDVIDSEFRKDPEAWKRRHPLAVGLLSLGRPVYSEDRTVAGASFSRLRNGFGGGVFFCLLQRTGNDWKVLWKQGILIE
ncbi:MAG TPA: hypothetical protein VGQ76_20020 [Thermoanaerobaculia bacterium]|jgi:hypothetical protein|nr:hypothetical protein [Thermoanaerobaculia bacterium]